MQSPGGARVILSIFTIPAVEEPDEVGFYFFDQDQSENYKRKFSTFLITINLSLIVRPCSMHFLGLIYPTVRRAKTLIYSKK